MAKSSNLIEFIVFSRVRVERSTSYVKVKFTVGTMIDKAVFILATSPASVSEKARFLREEEERMRGVKRMIDLSRQLSTCFVQ